ncbi:MAG: CoA-binding protein [Candidatus Latescibacteria bacterium]|nr:CoA-binding protein [Candidatus Latescibacterota bacterium]
MARKTVAILGASNDRRKYGNKAVRAYLAEGYTVYPINLHESVIEGLGVSRSVLDVPEALDRVSVYLPPDKGLAVIDEIARKGTRELFLNPGAESEALIARAEALGLQPILACSILEVGRSPEEFQS